MMMSIIQRGSIKAGVKYIPIMMIGAYIMYQLMMALATSIFSGFIL